MGRQATVSLGKSGSRGNPQKFGTNHGKPPAAATSKAGDFSSAHTVGAKSAGTGFKPTALKTQGGPAGNKTGAGAGTKHLEFGEARQRAQQDRQDRRREFRCGKQLSFGQAEKQRPFKRRGSPRRKAAWAGTAPSCPSRGEGTRGQKEALKQHCRTHADIPLPRGCEARGIASNPYRAASQLAGAGSVWPPLSTHMRRGHAVARLDDQIAYRRNAFGDLHPALKLVHENVGTAMSALANALYVLDAKERDISGGVVKLYKHTNPPAGARTLQFVRAITIAAMPMRKACRCREANREPKPPQCGQAFASPVVSTASKAQGLAQRAPPQFILSRISPIT